MNRDAYGEYRTIRCIEIHNSHCSIHNFFKYFFIIEMMLHSFYLLIVFVSFAGNEDNVSRLRQQTGGLYGVFPIGDTDCLLQIVFVQACQHVIDDVLRLFEAGIVGSDDNTVAQTGGLLGHDRTFPFVAVAACANYGYHFPPACQYVVDGIQYIHQSVRSVGVIYNGGDALRGADRIKSACYRM